MLQQRLRLSPEQKTQIEALQKEVDARLELIQISKELQVIEIMTEQARPLKGIQNRIETLGAPVPEVVDAPEERARTAKPPAPPQEPETRRPVLDTILASGWLNWEIILWVIIIALAVVTRLWDLAPRAFHQGDRRHRRAWC